MGEENIDFASEEIDPETVDMMTITGSPVKEPTDYVNELTDVDHNVVKEEGENLRQPSPSEATDLTKHLKRNSSVIVGSDHKFTVRSRYRRASTGSCHDACKYGHTHKHTPEKVIKRPALGTIREKKPLMRTSSDDNLAKSLPGKETKSKELRRLSLPGPTLVKDPPSRTEVTNSSKKVVTPTQSKQKRIQSEVKAPLVSTSGSSFGRSKIDIPAVQRTSQQKSSHKIIDIKTKEAGSSSEIKKVKAKEPTLRAKEPTLKGKESTLKAKELTLKKSGSVKARLYKDLKSFSRSKNQTSSEKVKVNKSSDVPEKAMHVIESNASSIPTENALKSSLANEEPSSTQKEFVSGKAKISNVSKKGTRFSLPSFSSPSSSKSTGQPKKLDSTTTKKIGQVMEKSGSKTNTPRAVTPASPKTKAKKTVVSRPEEKDSSAWKVKFKRGTVVNLQVASNSPRKLRFRRGKVLGEDQNKADAGTSLRNTDDTFNGSPDTPEHEKVHLRRQEAAVKKDNIDLNDVIEETASKLAKTRKSKVQALVGAFETVMSFRDRKPLVETGAS